MTENPPFICYICNGIFDAEKLQVSGLEDDLCPRCAQQFYRECFGCANLFHVNHCTIYQGEIYCASCYRTQILKEIIAFVQKIVGLDADFRKTVFKPHAELQWALGRHNFAYQRLYDLCWYHCMRIEMRHRQYRVRILQPEELYSLNPTEIPAWYCQIFQARLERHIAEALRTGTLTPDMRPIWEELLVTKIRLANQYSLLL